jgi:hypothetical protein
MKHPAKDPCPYNSIIVSIQENSTKCALDSSPSDQGTIRGTLRGSVPITSIIEPLELKSIKPPEGDRLGLLIVGYLSHVAAKEKIGSSLSD